MIRQFRSSRNIPWHKTVKVDFQYVLLGIALYSQNKYKEALAAYDEAISIDPTNSEAHYNKGEIAAHLGIALKCLKKYEDAIISFDSAI